MEANSKAYTEPFQTSKMEVFAKIVNGFLFLTIFAKSSILDVWQDFEFASEANNDLRKKLHLRSPMYSLFSQNYSLFAFLILLTYSTIYQAIQYCAQSNPRDLMFNIFA